MAQKEDQLLDAIFKFGLKGATQQDIQSVVGKFDQSLLELLNTLVQQGKVKVLQGKDGYCYQAVSKDEMIKFRGLTDIDLALYQSIEATRDKGIWVRDLCNKTGVSQTPARKSLKILESRKLIKEVKVSTGKKVYMLTEYEPTPYHNRFAKDDGGEMNMELLTSLQEEVLHAIEARAFSSAEEIADIVMQKGFEIKNDEVEVIASTLIYDGLIDVGPDPRPGARRNALLYRPTRVRRPPNGFTDIPCGKCPLFHLCTPGADISPEKCVYYSQWLEEL